MPPNDVLALKAAVYDLASAVETLTSSLDKFARLESTGLGLDRNQIIEARQLATKVKRATT